MLVFTFNELSSFECRFHSVPQPPIVLHLQTMQSRGWRKSDTVRDGVKDCRSGY